MYSKCNMKYHTHTHGINAIWCLESAEMSITSTRPDLHGHSSTYAHTRVSDMFMLCGDTHLVVHTNLLVD